MRDGGTGTPKDKTLDDSVDDNLFHDSASLALRRATQMPSTSTWKLLMISNLSGEFTNGERQ